MWFLAVLFVASFVLTAFLAPKVKLENAKASTLDDFSFPRSEEGDAVPRFYGTLRMKSPNTISLSGFRAVPIKKKVKTGILSSKKIITGYKYYATIDLAWALGPDVVYRKMWFGEDLVWAGCLYTEGCVNEITLNLPELYGGSKDGNRGGIAGTVSMYCGAFDQPRNAYLEANLDPNVPAYVGIAHTVFEDFWWGNTPQIDAVSMEMVYAPNALGIPDNKYFMPNGLDINAIGILYDILVDDWGNLGYDPSLIDVEQWREIALLVYDEGMGMSFAVSSASEAKDVVQQIIRQVSMTMYEDQATGMTKIKLIRPDYDIMDLPVLGPSEILEVRNFTRKLWSETNNVVRVKYTDREAGYVEKVAIAKDFALLRFQGRQRPVDITMPGIKDSVLANEIAARELSNVNIPLHACELVLNRTATSLAPSDVFILQWPEYGITQMIMRVRKPNLGTLEKGTITLSVAQDEFGSAATLITAPVPSEYTPTTLVPVDIAELLIAELPAFLDYNAVLGTRAGYSRIYSLAKAPTSYTLGYDAYIEDGADDIAALDIAPYTDNAELVTPIAQFDGFNDGVIAAVVVDTVSDPAVLLNTEDPRLCGNLIQIGNELLVYETVTDNLDGTYTLNNLHRAMLDSGWEAHVAGARVWLFDGQEGFFGTDVLPGTALDIYLLDRTATGTSAEADAIVTTYNPIGRVERVVAPDYVTLDTVRDADQFITEGIAVDIDARARSRLDTVTAWYEGDAASTPEAGTTYDIDIYVEGTVIAVDAGVTLPYAFTPTLAMVGVAVLRVYAVKDTLRSISYSPMPVIVLPADELLTVDYSLVTIDSVGIEF